MKFDTNIGAEAFVWSKIVDHGTLRFRHKTLAENVYTLGITLVNKQLFSTTIKHQFRDGAPMTWQSSEFNSDSDSHNKD